MGLGLVQAGMETHGGRTVTQHYTHHLGLVHTTHSPHQLLIVEHRVCARVSAARKAVASDVELPLLKLLPEHKRDCC